MSNLPPQSEKSIDLNAEIELRGRRARNAALALVSTPAETRTRALLAMASTLEKRSDEILAANAKDLDAGKANGLSTALLDRLRLTPERISSMANGVREVAAMPDPVNEEIQRFTGAQGITIRRIRVPIGVIGIIYESRPNVTCDASVLCLKAGNATILRGGREAIHSNLAIAKILEEAGTRAGLPPHCIQLIPFTDREAVALLCKADKFLDLIIPRGGHGLIETVVANARVPVIKHYDGICHIYVDASAQIPMALNILLNAKCQRPGVCNAAETLLVHQSIAPDFLPIAAKALHENNVTLRVDNQSKSLIGDSPPTEAATEDDWTTEYLDRILAIRTVSSLDEAIEHINHYGSKHSDAIITDDTHAAKRFQLEIDSATVYWNASTRFTDGSQFGFGAEIGISTDKLHARGPMGLLELCSYKFLIDGQGQVRD